MSKSYQKDLEFSKSKQESLWCNSKLFHCTANQLSEQNLNQSRSLCRADFTCHSNVSAQLKSKSKQGSVCSLNFTLLYCIAFQRNAMHLFVIHCNVLQCTAKNQSLCEADRVLCNTLHCIALQCTRNALQYGAIHKSKSEQKSRSLCEAGLELQTAYCCIALLLHK